MSAPDVARIRTLPAYFEQAVSEDFIDENGHMNITHYFRLATWAPWLRLEELGLGERYIAERGSSLFTVEHRIRYLGELRLGERFAVHTGIAGRAGRAVHSVGFVIDRERDRLACALEVMYVHISMATRRAEPIPDDIAAAIDAEVAAHPWVGEVATGLSLRR